MQANQSDEPAESRVISPFSDAEGRSQPRRRKSRLPLWISLGVVLFAIFATGGIFLIQYLNDPLRTLEPFPVSKYLDGYKALAGSKFRANFRIENDLGWKEGIGRIMVFTIPDDPHPVVVMIPPSLATIYFVKGQTYEGELEVKEGGLIYANSCRKN